MKRVWPTNGPLKNHSGHFKMSYNPTGLIFKELFKKKLRKPLDEV